MINVEYEIKALLMFWYLIQNNDSGIDNFT